MNGARKLILAAGFGVSLAAIGVPYWALAYQEISLPNSLLGAPLLIVMVTSAVVSVLRAASWRAIVSVMGALLPTVVMLRVIVECTIDPTSHNLWPFEMIIAGLLGFPCAAAGTTAGCVLAKCSASAEDAT